MAHLIDIKDLLKEELIKELALLGVENFRAEQILDWIYKKYICDFDRMLNLPTDLRNSLKERFYISDLVLIKQLVSKDGTRKFLFKLEDGQNVETVFIPSKNTNTVCISSQVGCKFSCRFCASGLGGFIRNLRPAEMVNQVMNALNITNVVFMGMGEPLDNYENLLKAIRILNAPYGLNIGQRKITISTCGIIPGIKRLAEENLQIELSISLHSPNDKSRLSLMTINEKYPIKDLIETCREYINKTNRQVTFEYILIKGINDSNEDAKILAKLLKGMLAPLDTPFATKSARQCLTGLAKVNLIAFNPIEGLDYIPPEPKIVKGFKNMLEKNGILSVIRVSRGQDIDAACGQLRLRHDKEKQNQK